MLTGYMGWYVGRRPRRFREGGRARYETLAKHRRRLGQVQDSCRSPQLAQLATNSGLCSLEPAVPPSLPYASSPPSVPRTPSSRK